jgi:hypothetical protein
VKSNTEYWSAKRARNKARDMRHTIALEAAGWTVLTIWAIGFGLFPPDVRAFKGHGALLCMAALTSARRLIWQFRNGA